MSKNVRISDEEQEENAQIHVCLITDVKMMLTKKTVKDDNDDDDAKEVDAKRRRTG